MANTEHTTLVHQLRALMRVRSVDLRVVANGVGASSSILDDMTVEQLEKVIQQVKVLPIVKAKK